MEADAELLGRLKGFSWLSSEKREALATKLRVAPLKTRSRVYVTGESANQVYLVLRGLIQVGEPDNAVTSIVGPGEIYGFTGLIFDHPGLFFYRALSDSYIGAITSEDFIRSIFGIAPENIGLLLDFIFKKWWGGAILRMFHSHGLSVEHRLSRALGDLGAKIGVQDSRGTILDIPITHQALAELVGASRPKVTEAIRKMIRSGKIVRDHRRMILVDVRGGGGAARDPQLRRQIRQLQSAVPGNSKSR
jgi:CRP-like cAMP-binding protein